MSNRRMLSQPAGITALIFILPVLTAAGLRAGEIHDAAAAGDLNKVRALLEADPTLLESKDNDGNTPLISACFAPPFYIPKVVVANFLIDKGANVNAKNNWGGTPLYVAIKDFDLMQRLVAKGAEVNVKAFGHITPLHVAASSGNLKVAKLLMDHGADLNARSTGETVLRASALRQLELPLHRTLGPLQRERDGRMDADLALAHYYRPPESNVHLNIAELVDASTWSIDVGEADV
jgi:hypothetical protein